MLLTFGDGSSHKGGEAPMGKLYVITHVPLPSFHDLRCSSCLDAVRLCVEHSIPVTTTCEQDLSQTGWWPSVGGNNFWGCLRSHYKSRFSLAASHKKCNRDPVLDLLLHQVQPRIKVLHAAEQKHFSFDLTKFRRSNCFPLTNPEPTDCLPITVVFTFSFWVHGFRLQINTLHTKIRGLIYL